MEYQDKIPGWESRFSKMGTLGWHGRHFATLFAGGPFNSEFYKFPNYSARYFQQWIGKERG